MALPGWWVETFLVASPASTGGAFGTPRFGNFVFPESVNDGQVGRPSVGGPPREILPDGIESAEAFGGSESKPGAVTVVAIALPSDEAVGEEAEIALGEVNLSPPSIDSEEVLPDQYVGLGLQVLLEAGNTLSSEAFGVAKLNSLVPGVSGIPSGEAFGSLEIPFVKFKEENLTRTNVAVPVRTNGCYLTLVGGGGGGGGAGVRGGTGTGNGGGGGGGGGRIKRLYIPVANLGATYSCTVGVGGNGNGQGTSGVDGTASTFTSGSVTITAGGGFKGITGASTRDGGAGGTVSTGAFTYEDAGAGTAGGLGGTSGAGEAGTANTTGAGATGGGGGGANRTYAYPGGAGGNSATQTGGAGGGGYGGVGGSPGAQTGGLPGAGAGGAAGGYSTAPGGNGGVGGSWGGGGGGGGGKEGLSQYGGAGGKGGPGYVLIEWV